MERQQVELLACFASSDISSRLTRACSLGFHDGLSCNYSRAMGVGGSSQSCSLGFHDGLFCNSTGLVQATMRIVILSFWFSEGMGYITNLLPKALASLGQDVHVVTSTAQFYYNTPTYAETYEPFIGPPIVSSGTKIVDGYMLHRLPVIEIRKRIGIKGLWSQLQALRPDIVQTVDTVHLSTYQAVLAAPFLKFKLFTGCHVHASVFPPAQHYDDLSYLSRLRLGLSLRLPGRVVDHFTSKCYPIAPDAADIAVKFFGVSPNKVDICPLGVDTELFQPSNTEDSGQERLEIRSEIGFAESEIVCIYTGRFSSDKNPLCLAQAVDLLVAQGQPFRGLFIGAGPQEDSIRACQGCVVRPFVPVRELPPYYRAADIGVWPQQESTSMLDAAACGLPLVVSDRVLTTERIDGNGITYKEGDHEDLARALCQLKDPHHRATLGQVGSAKMVRDYSWLAIAKRRLHDYEVALRSD